MRTRGAHKIVCQEIQKYQVNRWSKPKLIKGIVVGIDKRLLNISRLDGGYGLTINDRPPMRAKILTMVKGKGQKHHSFNNVITRNRVYESGYRDYVSYAEHYVDNKMKLSDVEKKRYLDVKMLKELEQVMPNDIKRTVVANITQ